MNYAVGETWCYRSYEVFAHTSCPDSSGLFLTLIRLVRGRHSTWRMLWPLKPHADCELLLP